MELSDIWLKMARNENLTPQELDFLRIAGKQTQQTNAQMAGLINPEGNLNLMRPIITNPKYIGNALSLLYLTRTTDTAITTGTDTAVEFENIINSSDAFFCDLADPTKIKLTYVGQSFAVMGKVAWEANATGYRNVKLEAFDIDGVSLGGTTLNSHQGFTGADNIFPFVLAVSANQFPTMHDFRFTVGHTRGSNLNLLFFDAHIFVV